MTADPCLAAAFAAVLFTGVSFQGFAIAGPGDYGDAAAVLVLHGRVRCTEGCAAHRVLSWVRVFLKAAVSVARLGPGQGQYLLAGAYDRTHLLRVAEAARLRPPWPSVGRHARRGRAPWLSAVAVRRPARPPWLSAVVVRWPVHRPCRPYPVGLARMGLARMGLA